MDQNLTVLDVYEQELFADGMVVISRWRDLTTIGTLRSVDKTGAGSIQLVADNPPQLPRKTPLWLATLPIWDGTLTIMHPHTVNAEIDQGFIHFVNPTNTKTGEDVIVFDGENPPIQLLFIDGVEELDQIVAQATTYERGESCAH